MAIKKLGKRTDIRLHIIKNQATELLWNGKIETTVDRAKSVRRVAEKILTLAINSYDDVVKVTKNKLNQKNESIKVEYDNDGPKKLAARRKIMASIYLKPEEQQMKEKKADFKARTADIKHPIVEKIFREYAPKYAKRADDLKQKGGFTRIIKIGNRRGDNAEMCYIELVD